MRRITKSELQIIAAITMVLDHLYLIFPSVSILRIIGRLTFPIFAYCIAEGCKYSRDKTQYLFRILCCAAAFQLIAGVLTPGYPVSVVWGYAAAVGYTILADWSARKEGITRVLPLAYAFTVSMLLMALKAEYLCLGFLLPLIFTIKKSWLKWLTAALSLSLLGLMYQYQLWALLALPILMLYNGKKGRLRLGKLLYYFYPLHYAVLAVIALILG